MPLSVPSQFGRALPVLVCFHILIIAASNYLVQLPVTCFGLLTTWGTFTFPLVYLATDLTVRIFGAARARIIIFRTMLPALLLSYLISIVFSGGSYQGIGGLGSLNILVLRIALASFTAYVSGQLLDITVFAYLRRNRHWWVAPGVSTIIGNLVDTLLFYSLAFSGSSDPLMAAHWPEIAAVDYGFKLLVSIFLFLPAYGLLLTALSAGLTGNNSGDYDI